MHLNDQERLTHAYRCSTTAELIASAVAAQMAAQIGARAQTPAVPMFRSSGTSFKRVAAEALEASVDLTGDKEPGGGTPASRNKRRAAGASGADSTSIRGSEANGHNGMTIGRVNTIEAAWDQWTKGDVNTKKPLRDWTKTEVAGSYSKMVYYQRRQLAQEIEELDEDIAKFKSIYGETLTGAQKKLRIKKGTVGLGRGGRRGKGKNAAGSSSRNGASAANDDEDDEENEEEEEDEVNSDLDADEDERVVQQAAQTARHAISQGGSSRQTQQHVQQQQQPQQQQQQQQQYTPLSAAAAAQSLLGSGSSNAPAGNTRSSGRDQHQGNSQALPSLSHMVPGQQQQQQYSGNSYNQPYYTNAPQTHSAGHWHFN